MRDHGFYHKLFGSFRTHRAAIFAVIAILLLISLSRHNSNDDVHTVLTSPKKTIDDNDDLHTILTSPTKQFDNNDYLIDIASRCPVPAGQPRMVLDVGGNKGYSLPRYGLIWGNLDVSLVRKSIGHYQDKSAMWFGNALELHVFEPTRSAFEILEHLTSEIPMDGIFLHNLGVSEIEGNFTFSTPYDNAGDEGAHMGHTKNLPEEGPSETVKVVTLDAWYQGTWQHGYPGRIPYVKIDTEGFDALVVRGMTGLLAGGKIEAFEFEYASSWIDGRTPKPEKLHDLLRMLLGYSFHCFKLSEDTAGSHEFVRINTPGLLRKELDEICDLCTVVCINKKMECFDGM